MNINIPFRTFRELRDALNQLSEEALDRDVVIFDDMGCSSRGGTLEADDNGTYLLDHA